jgi:hypothetical protein
MEETGQKITCGDFKALRQVVARTGIEGYWKKSTNHCQYRTESGAALNYWKNTGTISIRAHSTRSYEYRLGATARLSRDRNAMSVH